jgi:hypothetical protein
MYTKKQMGLMDVGDSQAIVIEKLEHEPNLTGVSEEGTWQLY